MDDRQFRQLLDRFDLSWSGYRRVRGGVKKRLQRHMLALGCRNFQDYMAILTSNPAARRKLDRVMTVSVSRFFRDRKLWEIMEGEIIPYLVCQSDKRISVWSAGCAMGQEIYSFKRVWGNLKVKNPRLPELRMLATDVDPGLLKKARAGVYAASSLRGISEELKKTVFEPVDEDRYRVRDELRGGIEWKVHDLVRDSVDGMFHLLFLRNSVFTYHREAVQVSVLKKVLNHLENGGVIVIGCHEDLPPADECLRSTTLDPSVFVKSGAGGPA